MTASEQSKKRVNFEGTTVRSKACAWSSLRGKPSHQFVSTCLISFSPTHDTGKGWIRKIEAAKHTVNQKQALCIASLNTALHRILQQLHRNLHGHNRAFFDIRLDHLAKLAAGPVLFFAQQVARRKVLEAIVRNEFLALSPLAGTGSAKHEDDGDFVCRPEGRGARCCAEVVNGWHFRLSCEG
jgi:hypothetical protein